MGLISSVFMGEPDNGFWLTIIIRARRDIKRVNRPRPRRPYGFAEDKGFNIRIKDFFFVVGQCFKRGEN